MTASAPSSWSRVFPAISWLRHYERGWFRPDVAAGVTLAAYLLPSALADASLAGLPVQAGLYAVLFSGLVFWLFCSSRHTAVSVTSAISLLIGSSLGEIASGDTNRFVALASCAALLTAATAFIAWLIRAGAIVKFISETVMLGFKAGVALWLISTQLPKFCGFKGAHGNFWHRIADFIRHVGETNVPSVVLGLAALALLILGKRFLPNRPVALFIVIGGIAATSLMNLGSYGIKLLGEVPRGLPLPTLPMVSWDEITDLLRLGHGFPVSGGMSQSLVNESAQARTPLSGFISAILILLVAVFFSDTLRNLPQPVLAAIILMAVASLFKFAELRRLWISHRGEFFVAIMALLGVLWAGLLKGVLIGAVISIVMLIRRVSSPHVAFLGRIPGTRRYSDLSRHDTNEPIPDVLAFRVEAGIVYFNVDHISETVMNRVRSMHPQPSAVICDLSTSPNVDMAGARFFLSLHAELEKRGIALRLVEARSKVRDILRLEGVETKVRRIDRFTTLAEAIDDLDSAAATYVR